MSVNKVILIGNVGSDPEMRYPEQGRTIAFISLATNDYYGNPPTEVTEWHRLVLGGKNAEVAEKYIRKGSKLYVEGRLKTREFEDRFKVRRRITEVIVDKLELLGRASQ